MAGNNAKYTKLIEWIKTNIKKEDLDVFNETVEKCNYVINKVNEIPINECNRPQTYKSMYQLLYRIGYVNILDDKKARLEWMNKNKNDILNISGNDSKTINKERVIYATKKINEDLKTNYTEKQMRNYLTHANLLSKYFSRSSYSHTFADK